MTKFKIILYIIAQGYNANVGDIITNFEGKIYIQVAHLLADETIIQREFDVFQKITDNYPKYVLSMDKFGFSRNVIIHKNILDWLIEK